MIGPSPGLTATAMANRSRVRQAADPHRIWQQLLDGIWTVVRHDEVHGRRVLLLAPQPSRARRRLGLTPRERLVLERVVQGESLKAIAQDLQRRPSTVSQNLRSALRKLALRDVADAARVLGRRRGR